MQNTSQKNSITSSVKRLFGSGRRFVFVLLIVVCVVIAFLTYQGLSAERPIPAAVLSEGYLALTVEADGLIEAAKKKEIYAPSGLRIAEVFFDEGDAVKEGDILAQLDVEALSLEIQRAELTIRSAEAIMTSEQTALANSVASARNALASAEVALRTAKREFDSLIERSGVEITVAVAAVNLADAKRAHGYNLSLYEAGGVSRAELTTTQNALDKAQSAYDDAVKSTGETRDRAAEAHEAAAIRYKTAEDALRDAVERNTDPAALALELQKVACEEKLIRLREASIRATADGIVTLVNAKEGAYASGLMFVIEDNRNLIVSARVAETDIAVITPGVDCVIYPAGQAEPISGVVTSLPVAAERASTGEFSAVTGDDAYFIVKAAIQDMDDSSKAGVLIGMNAKVAFIIETRASCFAAPNGLIYRDGDRRWVVTLSSAGRRAEIPVQTGLETRRLTQIISDSLYEGMELYSRAD